MGQENVPVDALKSFAADVFAGLGVEGEEAATAADVLVQADLRGIDSHGVARLPIYVRRMKLGLIDPLGRATVVRETACTVVLDGGNGLGQVAGVRAMRLCLEKARVAGLCAAVVRRTNHFGIGAYYAMMSLPWSMIGVAAANSSPLMAPFGGRAAMLGTNPIAVAVPAGRELPVVLDMATSLVPRGKIELAARKGEKIPPDWAVDEAGRPTDDPLRALRGALLPLGGPKGYGMSVVIDIVSGVLAGAAFGAGVGSLFGDMSRPQNVGNFFLAMDIAAFRDVAEFKRDMDQLIRALKDSPRADGVSEIFLPGELEYLRQAERERSGIPLGEEVRRELARLAEGIGVRCPFA